MNYESQTHYIIKKLFPKKKKQVNEIPYQNTYYISLTLLVKILISPVPECCCLKQIQGLHCAQQLTKHVWPFLYCCVCACTCVNLSSGSYMSAMQNLQWPYYYECEYNLFVQLQPLDSWMAFGDYTTRRLRNYLPFTISFKFNIISPLLLSNSSLLLLQFCVGSN